jgi:hypothetical protein
MCGCGEKTPLANTKGFGLVRGQPTRFIRGHANYKPLAWDIDPDTGCWNWIGSVDGQGRGRLMRDKKCIRVYRFIYEREVGPVAEGMDLHHTCDNVRCVNPEHLEEISHVEHARLHAIRRWAA